MRDQLLQLRASRCSHAAGQPGRPPPAVPAAAGRKDIHKDKAKTAFVRNVPYRCVTACWAAAAAASALSHRCCSCSGRVFAAVLPYSTCLLAVSARASDIVDFFSPAGLAFPLSPSHPSNHLLLAIFAGPPRTISSTSSRSAARWWMWCGASTRRVSERVGGGGTAGDAGWVGLLVGRQAGVAAVAARLSFDVVGLQPTRAARLLITQPPNPTAAFLPSTQPQASSTPSATCSLTAWKPWSGPACSPGHVSPVWRAWLSWETMGRGACGRAVPQLRICGRAVPQPEG